MSAELAGHYQCVASGAAGSVVSRVAIVYLAEVPPLVAGPRSVLGAAGAPALLPCGLAVPPPLALRLMGPGAPPERRVYSAARLQSPPPVLKLNVTWLKNGSPVRLEAARVSVTPSGALELDPLREHDAAMYRCRVALSPHKHSTSDEIELRVSAEPGAEEPPRFVATPQPQTVIEGASVTFDCAAVGNPKPEMSWLNNGVAIDLNDLDSRFYLVGSGSLRVQAARALDAGAYTCRAHSKLDSADTSTTLQVLTAPRVSVGSAVVKARERGDVTLRCEARGRPAPRVLWLKDGEPLTPNHHDIALVDGSSLRIQGVLRVDAGMFQCYAWSAGGAAAAALRLVVLPPDDDPPKFPNTTDIFNSLISSEDPTLDPLQYDPDFLGETSSAYTSEPDYYDYTLPEGVDLGRENATIVSAPRGLKAVIVKHRFVTLSWQEPEKKMEDITEYVVVYRAKGSERERVSRGGASRLEMNVASLQPNTTYQFAARAVTASAISPATETVEVRTSGEEAHAQPPRDVRVEPLGPHALRVTWTIPALAPAHYTVHYTEVSDPRPARARPLGPHALRVTWTRPALAPAHYTVHYTEVSDPRPARAHPLGPHALRVTWTRPALAPAHYTVHYTEVSDPRPARAHPLGPHALRVTWTRPALAPAHYTVHYTERSVTPPCARAPAGPHALRVTWTRPALAPAHYTVHYTEVSDPRPARAHPLGPHALRVTWTRPALAPAHYTVHYTEVSDPRPARAHPLGPHALRVTWTRPAPAPAHYTEVSDPRPARAHPLGPHALRVTWTRPAPAPAHYTEVESGREQVVTAPAAAGEGAVTLEGLRAAAAYSVLVAGGGAASPPVRARTLALAPSAPPANVSADPASPTSILVRWEAPPARTHRGPLTGYKVRYRAAGARRKPDALATPADARRAELRDLLPHTTYQIRVCAMNANGSGPFSEWITAATQAQAQARDETRAPAMPPPLNTRAGRDWISVWWEEPVGGGGGVARGFRLGWGLGVPDEHARDLPAHTRHHVIRGLESNAEYVISLHASNALGAGPPVYATVRTRAAAAEGDDPGDEDDDEEDDEEEERPPLIPPVGLKVIMLSGTTAVVYWTDPTLPKGQCDYFEKLHLTKKTEMWVRGLCSGSGTLISCLCADGDGRAALRGAVGGGGGGGGGGPGAGGARRSFNASDLNCMLDDLKPFTTYEFAVKLIKGGQESAWSMIVSNTTLEAAPASPPRELSAAPAARAADLAWLPPARPNGVITEFIYVCRLHNNVRADGGEGGAGGGGGGGEGSWTALTAAGERTRARLERLRPRTLYSVKVQARNSKGLGPFCAPLAFTTGVDTGGGGGLAGATSAWLWASAGGACAVLALAAALALSLCCRRAQPLSPHTRYTRVGRPLNARRTRAGARCGTRAVDAGARTTMKWDWAGRVGRMHPLRWSINDIRVGATGLMTTAEEAQTEMA
ncbi:hypothetical protein MSG28_014935 [Choristoneura fumiferana]|uniref:Uncharacterized protein n=1 Tax=Choristoneura fumiferana TaxID=7141 RepID=A0ACC0KXY1_CHOFU|nr:hypothetical protein MSG28_014935 [Choristoneura fumiferana]